MKDRRTIVTTIGAVALTLVAGGTAIAANLGILDSTKDGPVGELSPIADLSSTTTAPGTTQPTVKTVYVDEYVTDGVGSGQSVPSPDASAPDSSDVTSAPVAGLSITPPVTTDDSEHTEDGEHTEDEKSESTEESHAEEPEHLEGAEDDD